LPAVFLEDFEEEESSGQFTLVNVAGPDTGFTWLLWDFGTTGALQGNGYGAEGPTKDWLIMSNPMNLDFLTTPQLIFDAQQSFSGPLPVSTATCQL
jgi:hypothetical protein